MGSVFMALETVRTWSRYRRELVRGGSYGRSVLIPCGRVAVLKHQNLVLTQGMLFGLSRLLGVFARGRLKALDRCPTSTISREWGRSPDIKCVALRAQLRSSSEWNDSRVYWNPIAASPRNFSVLRMSRDTFLGPDSLTLVM